MATRSNGQAAQPPTVKEVPCNTPIASVEGKDNFTAYCAVCHGTAGKGDGPAAAALNRPVPDLTTIAARNGGKFDTLALTRVISGVDGRPAAHGSVAMPIWGEAFSSSPDDKVASLRVRNLAKHLETMQQK
jgi:mono/diheme cytochrome c family protein